MLATLAGCAVFLAMMAGLFVPLEYLFPARVVHTSRSSMALGAMLFVVNTLSMQLISERLWSSVQLTSLRRSALIIAAVFVASDFAGYWIHRAMHRVPWLWKFHSLHHEATELSWLDAWRQHPVDFVLHGIVVGLPGALLGATLSDLASVVVLRKAFTTFLHANLNVNFGVWLASPVFHARHHSADARDYDTHFAGTFPVWDVLFGTVDSAHVDRKTDDREAVPRRAA
ncbi:MAG: sterol desaturase family protein [Archangium sp.]